MSNVLSQVTPRSRAVFARYWGASVALLLVILAAALVQFVRAPRDYIATQQLRIIILASSPSDTTNTASDAASLATALADPSVLSSPRLAGDVLAGLPVDMQAGASATALEGALAGDASGASLVLSATWSSPRGADELLSAAVTALQTDDALLPGSAVTDSIRILPAAPASPATLSSAQAASLVQTLIARILMAMMAAALMPFVLDALLARPLVSAQRT